MEKDRTRRYDSAAALAQDIDRHLRNDPVMARPPSATYRIGKFARRHKGAVAAVAAISVALVLGTIGTTVGLVRARAQTKAAEAARVDLRNANLFLRDLLMSFGNPAMGRPGVERAIQRLDAGWLADQPDTLIASRIALGFYLVNQNDPARAEQQFDAALQRSRGPDGTVPLAISAPIHAGIGVANWMRKSLPEAEQNVRKSIEEYRRLPGSGTMLTQMTMLLAGVHEAQGDAAGAAKLVDEGRRLAANDPAMRSLMGLSLSEASGQQEKPDAVSAAALGGGRFTEAIDGLRRAIGAEPSNHWNYYYLACTELYLGDQVSYRRTASEMLDRFGATDQAAIGDRTAKVCLLTPRPVGHLAALDRLLDQALKSDQDPAPNPWFYLGKALREYRGDRFESAIELCDRGHGLTAPAAIATLDAIRAMSHQRAGRHDRAVECLDRAAKRIADELPKPGADPITGPENWLICHILHREAQALVRGGGGGSPATQPAPGTTTTGPATKP
jgi:tetratricopeptide (TPR) repeat protein